MRILIVEDDFISSKLMDKILNSFGETVLAKDGLEGIAKFKEALKEKNKFDVIFLDIMMPKLNGHGVLAEIRELEKNSNDRVKVVMTTALNDYDNIEEAFENECELYLVKPLSKNSVVEALKKIKLLKNEE